MFLIDELKYDQFNNNNIFHFLQMEKSKVF